MCKHHRLLFKIIVYVINVFFTSSFAHSIQNLNPDVWKPTHDVSELRIIDNTLHFQCNGSDPYIITKPLQHVAKNNLAIEIVMKVSQGSQGQLFWSSDQYSQISEQNSHRFAIRTGKNFHTYLIPLGNHMRWVGTITRLRLDPCDQPADVEVQSFRLLEQAGPNMIVSQPVIQSAKIHPNRPTPVQVEIENTGDTVGTLTANLQIPVRAHLAHTPEEQSIRLMPQEKKSITWHVTFLEEWAGNVACDWELQDDTHHTLPKRGVTSTMIQVNTINPTQQTLSLTSGKALFDIHQTGLGYGSIDISIQTDENRKTMAWMPRLGTVMAQMDDGHTDAWAIFVDEPEVVSDNQLKFEKQWVDRNGRDWFYDLVIEKHEYIDGAFHFLYELKCNSNGGKPGRLVHFSGPELLVGEGSFEDQKDQAIFPGVEYLGRNDVSSSNEVAHPPVRDHFMPHPSKVTVPFLSLSHEDNLIALMWDNATGWNTEHDLLSPKFASPNRLQKQKNHLMGLFVPNVPEYTYENQEQAHQAYEMKDEEPVVIDCIVYVSTQKNALDAVDVWLETYHNKRLPDVMSEPRSYQESIALSRRAYFESCWDEEKMGWGHCAGWDPQPSGGFLALLDLDKHLTNDADQKLEARIDSVKKHMISQHGESSLGDARGCHVMTLEPGFYWGVMEHKLDEWLQRIKAYGAEQHDDGSWGFHAGSEEQTNLGKDGQVTSGTIAQKAAFILKYARITGNRDATEIGLKALEALNQFIVPHGAQGWECPLASPDILASGYGTQANLDAYLITQNHEYLEHAVYWAKTGIVFHYLWNHEETPLQRYATIPIFGATFYTHTWRGVPVQWCGLVYAYALQQLAEYDQSMEWMKLATGIVNSALMQQETDGEYAGTLPDSFGDFFVSPKPAFINPENILTNLHELKGNGFSINTVFVEGASKDAVRISGIGKFEHVAMSEDSLSFQFEPRHKGVAEVLISPIKNKPKKISIGDMVIDEKETLFGEEMGWKYLAKQQALLVHVQKSSIQTKIEIKD